MHVLQPERATDRFPGLEQAALNVAQKTTLNTARLLSVEECGQVLKRFQIHFVLRAGHHLFIQQAD